jgi:lipoprotein-anchoring transpeptidase ErfK/SrfK
MSPSSNGGASERGLRRLAVAAGLGAVLVGAGVAATLSLASSTGTRTSASTMRPASARVTLQRATSAPKRAVVATVIRARISVYRTPGARRAFVHFKKSNGYGQPRVFLVKKRLAGWEQVYLPMRPDGVTGWVRDSSVSLAYNPYRVVVSLGRHKVWAYKRGSRILATKAGVGRSISATPKGTYFLVMLLKQPTSNTVYGPYAFGTSAFSKVYYHFGGGPGEIGLHGTDDPQALGTNVSHGCIRIANWAIAKLAHTLPLGTPLVIEK